MTPLSIITDTLKSIPPAFRKGLLLAWALAVVAVGVLAIVDVSTGKAEEVLLYLGLYLGLQSAANVEPVDGP